MINKLLNKAKLIKRKLSGDMPSVEQDLDFVINGLKDIAKAEKRYVEFLNGQPNDLLSTDPKTIESRTKLANLRNKQSDNFTFEVLEAWIIKK